MSDDAVREARELLAKATTGRETLTGMAELHKAAPDLLARLASECERLRGVLQQITDGDQTVHPTHRPTFYTRFTSSWVLSSTPRRPPMADRVSELRQRADRRDSVGNRMTQWIRPDEFAALLDVVEAALSVDEDRHGACGWTRLDEWCEGCDCGMERFGISLAKLDGGDRDE